jgi:hypothetical protein
MERLLTNFREQVTVLRTTLGTPFRIGLAGLGACLALVASAGLASASRTSPSVSRTSSAAFLGSLSTVSSLGSTVPGNGDVNPYGIAMVPQSLGLLHAGDLLISNFNSKSNNQGTGTTIDQMTPSGHLSLFATVNGKTLPGQCPGGVGLTTALAALPGGYVVVGSLPTSNGKSATAKAGCLIVLNSRGTTVNTISGPQIAGPWDMTSVTSGAVTTLFVSMALNGGAAKGVRTINNSTVLRIRLRTGAGKPPTVISQQVVASGIPWRDDKAALVIGPTGVALAANGTLYVADTLENAITAVPDAMTRNTPAMGGGTTVSKGGHLIQPLGLTLAPNGDILATNAGNGNMVEITPAGKQLLAKPADPKSGAGSLFGLVVAQGGKGVFFVDDGNNTLRLLH